MLTCVKIDDESGQLGVDLIGTCEQMSTDAPCLADNQPHVFLVNELLLEKPKQTYDVFLLTFLIHYLNFHVYGLSVWLAVWLKTVQCIQINVHLFTYGTIS